MFSVIKCLVILFIHYVCRHYLIRVWKNCICLTDHLKKLISIIVSPLGYFLPQTIISTLSSCQWLTRLYLANIMSASCNRYLASRQQREAWNLIRVMPQSSFTISFLQICCCNRWLHSPATRMRVKLMLEDGSHFLTTLQHWMHKGIKISTRHSRFYIENSENHIPALWSQKNQTDHISTLTKWGKNLKVSLF